MAVAICSLCGTEKLPIKPNAEHRRRNVNPGTWCPRCKRLYHITRSYGITVEKYFEMLRAQDNKCGICKVPFDWVATKKPGGICIDHDHKTGKVRGILCGRCNFALGLLGEDRDNILRMLAYLKKHG